MKAKKQAKVRLILLMDQDILQRAINEHDPQVPCSTFEEQVWLEEALDQVIQTGNFSIQEAEILRADAPVLCKGCSKGTNTVLPSGYCQDCEDERR